MRWNGLNAHRCCNSCTFCHKNGPISSVLPWWARIVFKRSLSEWLFSHHCTSCCLCAAWCNTDIWWKHLQTCLILKSPLSFFVFFIYSCAALIFEQMPFNAEIRIKARCGGFLDPIQSPVPSFHYIWRLISMLGQADLLSRLKVSPCVFMKKAAGMWRRSLKIWVA